MITGKEPAYPTYQYKDGITIRQAYKMAAIQSGMYMHYLKYCQCDADTMSKWAGKIADAMIEEDNSHE